MQSKKLTLFSLSLILMLKILLFSDFSQRITERAEAERGGPRGLHLFGGQQLRLRPDYVRADCPDPAGASGTAGRQPHSRRRRDYVVSFTVSS